MRQRCGLPEPLAEHQHRVRYSEDEYECAAGRMERLVSELDGTGRLATRTLIAGTNGLANLVAKVGFKGSPTSIGGTILGTLVLVLSGLSSWNQRRGGS